MHYNSVWHDGTVMCGGYWWCECGYRRPNWNGSTFEDYNHFNSCDIGKANMAKLVVIKSARLLPSEVRLPDGFLGTIREGLRELGLPVPEDLL